MPDASVADSSVVDASPADWDARIDGWDATWILAGPAFHHLPEADITRRRPTFATANPEHQSRPRLTSASTGTSSTGTGKGTAPKTEMEIEPTSPIKSSPILPPPTPDRDASSRDKDQIPTDFFAYPNFSLQPPTLRFDFRMAVKFRPGTEVVELADGGKKEVAVIVGGRWSGTFGRGFVKAGGHDCPSSDVMTRSKAKIDTAFSLETHDDPPAILEMNTRGYISYPEGSISSLFSYDVAHVEPTRYAFRMVMSLRTSDARYAPQLNLALWIGSAGWCGGELVFDGYRIS